MGKYMRKSKVTGEAAVMEVTQPIGVRTRAKTLALQKLQKTTTTTESLEETENNSASSYFNLRSRKLEKTLSKDSPKKQQQQSRESCEKNPSSKIRTNQKKCSFNSGSRSVSCNEKGSDENDGIKEENYEDGGVEGSCGENILEIGGRERTTRESTPCSLIRDPEILRTPSSTTRRTSSAAIDRRVQNHLMLGNMPSTQEIEEFFSVAEQHQQRLFMEKYNFDPVNELPLPGRYEWERVDQ